jgi:hypothetical protein
MGEGRKCVLPIVAGILVERHLKTPEDLSGSPPGPRTESLTNRVRCSAIRWGTENDDHELRGNVGIGVAPGPG